MKCITICEPWVYAILELLNSPSGGKRVENRHWYCHYRGPLLIHAGKSHKWFGGPGSRFQDGSPEPDPSDCVFGAIRGVVNMTGCVRPHHESVKDHPFTEGSWCHVYENRFKFLEPIPYRGQQGLFDVPDDLVAEQLKNWEGFNHAA